MEIPVNPHWWQGSRSGGDRGVPHPSKARRVNHSTQTGESLLKGVSARCQRHAANEIHRRATRGALMQGSKETSERTSGVIRTLECRVVQRVAMNHLVITQRLGYSSLGRPTRSGTEGAPAGRRRDAKGRCRNRRRRDATPGRRDRETVCAPGTGQRSRRRRSRPRASTRCQVTGWRR
jgi:hypothetical protein